MIDDAIDEGAFMTQQTRPALDRLSTDYVTLAFGLERHIPGTVDAYYGPEEVKAAVLAGSPPSPETLVQQAEELLRGIPTSGLPESRAQYLTAQVRALHLAARRLTEVPVDYRDEVRIFFDIEPEATPAAVFDDAVRALDEALPGEGDVAARMIAWRKQFEVPVVVAREAIAPIADEARRRTASLVELPAGEEIDYAFVSDKPWSGYNWYLGDCRSLVELNTDLPLRINTLLGLLCHEGYPGHHTEHAIKEQTLYQAQGYGEHAIQLINTPECVISEGIATLAETIVFPDGEAEAWRAAQIYPIAGITGDPAREAQTAGAARHLRALGANAALMLHADGVPADEVVAYLMRYGLCDEQEARHRLRFIADPLWRAYVFTYHAGRDLLDAWLARGDRNARFVRLLREQVTPSQIAAELRG
jgi:hypothetical protein